MLSLDRDPDDLHPEIEVVHHAAHDRELLEVLAPEHRHVGLGRAEQLRDDGGDASEVAGAHRPLEPLGQCTGLDVRLEPGWVHRVDGRGVDRVDAGGAAGLQVVADRARVRVEISGPVELQRVHEDGHDDDVGPGGRDADECEMPVVECTHRRHHPDVETLEPPRVRPGAHRVRVVEDVHAAEPTQASSSGGTRRRAGRASPCPWPGARADVEVGGGRPDRGRGEDRVGAGTLERECSRRVQPIEHCGA